MPLTPSDERLVKAIEDFNEKSSDQAREMINLTRAIVVLTIVLVIGLLVQIAVAV